MRIFKEMADIVTKQRLYKIELLDANSTEGADALYLQLFKGISSGAYGSDEEAAQAIYQVSAQDKKYQMLKSRLKERMINSLFFINYKNHSDSGYQQAVFQCNRSYFCARILLNHGARSSAIAMAKSTLSLAQKFDLNDIAFLTARMLRSHFANSAKKAEQARYEKMSQEFLRKLRAETRAEFMYEQLVSEYAASKALKSELATVARDYFGQAKELAKYKNSFHLNLQYYRIGMLYYQIIRNYSLLFNLCQRYEQFLKKHPGFNLASRNGEIALLKMVCCLNLKDYATGIENAKSALQHFTTGSNNWFVVMENYFLLLMHSGHFEDASSLYIQVLKHPRFQYLNELKQEAWKIYEAYLVYLLPQRNYSGEFRVLKFVNEVPNYTRDKAGYYPAILIAQILFLLDRWEEDRLDKTIETLRIFSSRHLGGKKAPRTTLFIKMLRQLIHNNYDPLKVARKTKPYLEKLEGNTLFRQIETDSMEIVPYEKIWAIILDRLHATRNSTGRPVAQAINRVSENKKTGKASPPGK